MYEVIFLYNHGITYFREVLGHLQACNLRIRTVAANVDLVSNLVPNILQRGAESWLILPVRQQDLLILPFPDENLLLHLNNTSNFRDYLSSRLIPTLKECLTYESPHIPPDGIGRFQYIRHDADLDSLLRAGFDEDRSPLDVQIQSTLLETSRSIQRQRSEVLSKVLRTRDPVLIESIINELDEVLAIESDNIFQYLQTTQGSVEVVPRIVTDFEDIIDDKTKQFLITSETVRKFANDYSPDNFDYSAPGCGLWKAVERELNLSLVLYLRQQRNIVDINNPWQGSIHPGPQVQIQTGENSWVNLNKRERNNKDKLSAFTLGNMRYMLKWGNTNGIREDLENLSLPTNTLSYLIGGRNSPTRYLPPQKNLPQDLLKLTELRNGHAHTSAMSREKFEDLRKLVLPSDSNPGTCLVKILQLKRRFFNVSTI